MTKNIVQMRFNKRKRCPSDSLPNNSYAQIEQLTALDSEQNVKIIFNCSNPEKTHIHAYHDLEHVHAYIFNRKISKAMLIQTYLHINNSWTLVDEPSLKSQNAFNIACDSIPEEGVSHWSISSNGSMKFVKQQWPNLPKKNIYKRMKRQNHD